MPLTQRQVDAIRPTGEPFNRYDRDGLMVRVTAAGKGRWVWQGVVKGKRVEVVEPEKAIGIFPKRTPGEFLSDHIGVWTDFR